MPRIIPPFIERAHIQDARLNFEWDDWNVEKACEPTDDVLQKKLDRLTHRAVLSFAITACEWIAYRFAPYFNDPMPLDYLEAAWAAVVDWRYCRYIEPEDEKWRGPIRGPVSLGVIFVVDAILRVQEEDIPSNAAVCLAALALRVMPDAKPFELWRDRTLERLERIYPYRDEDPLGDPVPNEALDPEFDFHLEAAEGLIQKYLRNVSPGKNQYLRSDAEMNELKFRGVPYHFDIKCDRATRNDCGY